jgi:hypothetical protein
MHKSADRSEDRVVVVAAAVIGTTMAVVFVILATFVLTWRGVKWVTLGPFGLYRPAPPM